MGYNQSETGVVVSRRTTPVVHAIEVVPTIIIDGKPQGYRRVVHTGVQTEAVTRLAGIADPGTMSGANITMSDTNPPHEASFKGFTAARIGDSNLWEKITTDRTTTG